MWNRMQFVRRLAEEIVDGKALQQLNPLIEGYMPWSGSAMRPCALVAVLNDIIVNRRKCIVECGGGISTIFIGRLLNRTSDAHLYTIEHDKEW
ncbi:MAG: class I SAM-dependent methyltransferase, partial [Gammaproteobacteria bacterium]|nr:class I SAM-dependent methyltransferase [Gammaproteobacteria bacterium]